MSGPKGRVVISIRKYGFLLPPAEEEEEERWCLGQPSTQQALISHLDVIYSGLHKENSVYCNRDHNYHRSVLSQDQCRVCVHVCVCSQTGCMVYTVVVCVFVCLYGDIFACINGLMQRKWCLYKPAFIWIPTTPLSLQPLFFPQKLDKLL